MFAFKCKYVFSGTEREAKKLLYGIKSHGDTLFATLKKTGENTWEIPCTFSGKHLPWWAKSLIKKRQ